MKKILVILIALLFIGIALAEEVPQNPGDGPGPMPTLFNGNDLNLPPQGPPVGPQLIAQNLQNQTRAQIQRIKASYEAVRERIKDAKEEYKQALEQYKDRKEEYLKLAKRYNDANSEMKNQYSAQIRVHAKGILSNQADALIKKLVSLQDKNIAPDMAEEWIAQLEDIRIEMDSNDTNKEAIIATIKEIRDNLIPGIKYHSQLKAANALNGKFQAIFKKSAVTVDRTNNMIEKLTAKGYDTTSVEEALVLFEEKIGEAKIKYEEAKALWADANTSIEKHEILKQGFEIAKEANKIIIEGFHDLKDALHELRSQEVTNNDEDESDEDDEPEDDNNNDGSVL